MTKLTQDLKAFYEARENVFVQSEIGRCTSYSITTLAKELIGEEALFQLYMGLLEGWEPLDHILKDVFTWLETRDSGRCIVFLDDLERADDETLRALGLLLRSGQTPSGKKLDLDRVWFIFKSPEELPLCLFGMPTLKA